MKKMGQWTPSEQWIRSRNPVTKNEIIKWYERELACLKKRLKGPIKRKMELASEGDEENEIVYVDCWKISGERKVLKKGKEGLSDFEIYKQMLDDRFKQLKKECNERVRRAKNSAGNT